MTLELLTMPEVLRIKLGIWEARLAYAKETGKTRKIRECEAAIADLTDRLTVQV